MSSCSDIPKAGLTLVHAASATANALKYTGQRRTSVLSDMRGRTYTNESSADRAGLPAGGVSYPITYASQGEEIYEQFWQQVLALAETDARELSTVLLLTVKLAYKRADAEAKGSLQ